jgi:hypothetical protein
MGKGEVHRRFLWGNLRERDHLEIIGIDGGIILRWIFKKWDGETWTRLIWLRIGHCKRSNEISGCIKCGEFLN